MYQMSSPENQDKGFGGICLNQVWYDENSEKRGNM